MPLVMMPISVLTMKMPPSVTTSITSRKPELPASPPMVPGSSVRIRLFQQQVAEPAVLGRRVEDRDDEGDQDDPDRRHDEQAEDQGDRAARP